MRRPEYAECFMPAVVDMSHSRRFAYALIDPPSASPADLLLRAFERRVDTNSIGLAASHYGAMMVVFGSEAERNHVMRLFPFPIDGHVVLLERQEDGENRALRLGLHLLRPALRHRLPSRALARGGHPHRLPLGRQRLLHRPP